VSISEKYVSKYVFISKVTISPKFALCSPRKMLKLKRLFVRPLFAHTLSTELKATFKLSLSGDDVFFDMEGIPVPHKPVRTRHRSLQIVMCSQIRNPEFKVDSSPHVPNVLELNGFGWFSKQARSPAESKYVEPNPIKRLMNEYYQDREILRDAFRALAIELASQPPRQLPIGAERWTLTKQSPWKIEE